MAGKEAAADVTPEDSLPESDSALHVTHHADEQLVLSQVEMKEWVKEVKSELCE